MSYPTHNSGKLHWENFRDNIYFDENKNKYCMHNSKAIDFFVFQLFNLIQEYAKTPQKKPSSNPLFTIYTDKQINLVDQIKESYKPNPDEFVVEDLNYLLYCELIRGNTLAVMGFIPLLTRAYVILNLFVSEFYTNINLINTRYSIVIMPGGLDQFYSCDNRLPKFYEKEFRKIESYIVPIIIQNHLKKNKLSGKCICNYCFGLKQTNTSDVGSNVLDKEQLVEIKNFCAMLFKSLYLIYRDYPYEIELIKSEIYGIFGFDYHEQY
jgi:hypothetical protein